MDDKSITTIEELLSLIEQSGKSYDLAVIERAYQVAKTAHGDQLRSSGAPYISHPLSVATILIDLGMDTESLVAALLHDVVEDTQITMAVLQKQFGKQIALLVGGVTKLGQIPFNSREEQQAENLRKMLLAMSKDIRVMIIKLADRLHNARTFQYLTDDKARYKSLETMEIYAPIADRLGIRMIKEEFEDICLKYLDPVAYKEIESQSFDQEKQHLFLDGIKARLMERIQVEHPTARIEGRVKSIYGIYRKVYMHGRGFGEVYDTYAVRIIVDSIIECYNILGIVHDMFRPIPNRFRDYISTPKQNKYQSLQTTVFDGQGTPFETQIRTEEMHQTAEYGIAAHWKYKVGGPASGKGQMEDHLAWVRQLLESIKEGVDAEELVRSIKSDLAPGEVFVVTPKGKIICLPAGATVLDFAYAIHSAVGNKTVGGKVDGKIISIDSTVSTGMVVEILTQNNKTPNRDWLSIVKTNEARTKIRSWFKKERREENIQEGKLLVERDFKRNNMNMTDEQLKTMLTAEAKRHQLKTPEDFYASVGYGGIALSRIITRLREAYIRLYRDTDAEEKKPVIKLKKERKASSGVIVENLDNCLVKFAKCCNPLPGDSIVGFVTRGYGVSIHNKDCPSATIAISDATQKGRWLSAHWAETVKETYQASIEVIGQNRGGLLADLSILLNNLRIAVHSFIAKELKDGTLSFQVAFAVSDVGQLEYVMGQIKKIPKVVSVERIAG